MKAFEERHPESVEVLRKIVAEPRSSGFGNATFHGLNTFLFTNAAGATVPVRWVLEPMQPSEAAGDALPDKNYLFEGVDVGTLTIDRVEAEEISPAAEIVFDPPVLPTGMAPSDDPVIRVRSPVYSESHRRREGEKKQPSAITPADVKTGK